MITEKNFKDALLAIGFSETGNILTKYFKNFGAELKADFDKKELIYPEDKKLIINERQTCNFSANENFVVFECVHRLLEKGYKPEHLELEPKWKVGRGASGGRADILIKDNQGKSLLIIECKTAGKEFNEEWKNMLNTGGQVFSYVQQEKSTKYACLYTSDYAAGNVEPLYHLLTLIDNEKLLEAKKDQSPISFKIASSAQEIFRSWSQTYSQDYSTKGLFENDIQAYNIGKLKYTEDDLKIISEADIQPKYHQFATILRQHNVSGRENAFDKLVNLFLCKIVDEKNNNRDLQFYWKGIAYDTFFDLIDRLQKLYKDGMELFLKEEVTYIDDQTIKDTFKYFKNDPDATRSKILEFFREQKYFTNNDFAFIDVHNERLFYQNAIVLLKIVQMIQDIRLNGDQQNQFLGDMFEFFLDQGFKQSEGQFFTPTPITKFILMSLPLEDIIEKKQQPPKVIDYACGAGHFLNELAAQIKPFVIKHKKHDVNKYYKNITGIEKEYRLSKVAKVSAFMYSQDDINIKYADALSTQKEIKDGKFDILISNPPYSVKGFLETLSETDRKKYELFNLIDEKSYPNFNSIETFFIERSKQLLAPGGVAGIIVPSSILSNSDSTYTATREIILKYFDIIAIAEFGSGTFGKTVTNTVTLFLRRKLENPAPSEHYKNRVDSWFNTDTEKDKVFEDSHLLKKYCEQIQIDYSHYITLLQNKPSKELLTANIFIDYRKAFDNSTDAKNLKSKRAFQVLPIHEQAAALDKHFISIAKKIEKEKVYYFVLVFAQPNKVLIVKSPTDNKEQKKYLGYEWSEAKGNEGIKYLGGLLENIQTPLYNPINTNDTKKINWYIQENYLNNVKSIPAELNEYLSYNNLVNTLDFSRKDFSKQINISANKTKSIVTKWALVKLGDYTNIKGGDTFKEKYQGGKKGIPFFKVSDMNVAENYLTMTKSNNYVSADILKNEIKATVFPVDTIIFPKVGMTIYTNKKRILGCEAAIDNNSMGVIVKENSKLLPRYLFEYFQSFITLKDIASNANPPSISAENLYEVKISLPSEEIQKIIITECELVDNKIVQANASLTNINQQILQIIDKYISKGQKLVLSSIVTVNKTTFNPGKEPEKTFTYVDIDSVEKGTGKIYYTQKVLGKNAPSRARRIAPKDSTIISTVRPYLKGFAYIDAEINDCIYSTGFAVLESKDLTKLLNKVIFYLFMYSNDLMLQMESKMGKAAYPSINQSDIENFRIPVSSLPSQIQFLTEVEALDEQIKNAQEIIDNAALKKQEILKTYL